jgi:hypothetical protein
MVEEALFRQTLSQNVAGAITQANAQARCLPHGVRYRVNV